MTESGGRKYIVRIVVRELFGRYSYDLAPKADPNSLSQLFILYGENGTGKTKILWLLNHLLSKEFGMGHRTFLAETQFAEFAVYLSDGTMISATRPTATIGKFKMQVKKNGKEFSYSYEVGPQGNITGDALSKDKAHQSFRSELPDLQLTVLPDDRRVGTPLMGPKYAIREGGYVRLVKAGEAPEEDPSALDATLDALQNWATRRAVEGSNAGQRDVNTVYIDLLKRLAKTDEHQDSLLTLIERLDGQEKRSALFSRFGLSSKIDVDSITKTIVNSDKSRQNILAQVVKPYLDGNEARLDALDSVQRTLATFVDELNLNFLKSKQVNFDLARGVRIVSSGQELKPNVLSSGEKQLLVLFCNVAQASDRESIFIIDEPELSLNVNWQRSLIRALQKLGAGSVQFVFATHSLELLARHRENVAELSGGRQNDPTEIRVPTESEE
jgi:energy-coupling factor transporter ATP-binding protein EcfA2